MTQTTLNKLISKLEYIRSQKDTAIPTEDIITYAKTFLKEEEKQIAESFDSGYLCGKRILTATGKAYFENTYKPKKFSWNL
jgi:hypothetical protein